MNRVTSVTRFARYNSGATVRRALLAACALLLSGCGETTSPPAAPPPPPPAPPLPPPPPDFTYTSVAIGGANSVARDINDNGQAVGNSDERATLWTLSGSAVVETTDLGILPASRRSSAAGVNNLGQVVGSSSDDAGAGQPFIWTSEGGMRALGLPDGLVGGRALDINESGQIVGVGVLTLGGDVVEEGRVVLWTVDAGGNVLNMQGLGAFDGKGAMALAINELGQVVGDVWLDRLSFEPQIQHGFLWTQQSGAQSVLTGTAGINDRGVVAGTDRGAPITGSRFQDVAAIWQDGTKRGLSLDRDVFSVAFDVNNQGRVAGWSVDLVARGFVWEDGHMRTLSPLLGHDGSSGEAINEEGLIVGWSEDGQGLRTATLWVN